MDIEIRQADERDISALDGLYNQIGKNDEGYFEMVLEKDCVVLIASSGNQDVGFGILNFEPKYNLYKKLEIPEIQDVNVIPDMRERGIATALIDRFESLAHDQGADTIGISVGLSKDYGPAQRLYYKLGYQPDGYGVMYDRQVIKVEQAYPVDDDLCLMMVKALD